VESGQTFMPPTKSGRPIPPRIEHDGRLHLVDRRHILSQRKTTVQTMANVHPKLRGMGKRMRDAYAFARIHASAAAGGGEALWHSFSKDRTTVNTIKRLVVRGLVVVNWDTRHYHCIFFGNPFKG